MSRKSVRGGWLLVVPALLGAAAVAVFAAAGSLDPSFGTGGVVQIPGTNPGTAWDAVVQPDGRLIVGGQDTGSARVHWRIRRLLLDGTADTSFGTAGLVSLFGEARNEPLVDVTLDGSGRILAVGTHNFTPTVVRLNGDGSLDSTFGSGGVVTLSVPGTSGNSASMARAVAVQPDGRIVVAGTVPLVAKKAPNGYQNARFAARLGTNGALDTAFGAGGFCIDDLTTGDDSLGDRALALQSDGKIVLGGAFGGTQTYAISRLLANGAVDTGFGTVGTAFYARRLAVDGANRILVSGTKGGDGAVARYTASGGLDTTFGVNGTATLHDLLFATGAGGGLAVRPDGRIVVGTVVTVSVNSMYLIRAVRLLQDGQLDATFGAGGRGDPITTSAGAPQDLALAPDGGLFLVGWLAQVGVQNSQKWFAARYLGD